MGDPAGGGLAAADCPGPGGGAAPGGGAGPAPGGGSHSGGRGPGGGQRPGGGPGRHMGNAGGQGGRRGAPAGQGRRVRAAGGGAVRHGGGGLARGEGVAGGVHGRRPQRVADHGGKPGGADGPGRGGHAAAERIFHGPAAHPGGGHRRLRGAVLRVGTAGGGHAVRGHPDAAGERAAGAAGVPVRGGADRLRLSAGQPAGHVGGGAEKDGLLAAGHGADSLHPVPDGGPGHLRRSGCPDGKGDPGGHFRRGAGGGEHHRRGVGDGAGRGGGAAERGGAGRRAGGAGGLCLSLFAAGGAVSLI